MTTVGYGGVTLITPGGKLLAIVIMIFGTFYMAMPLTIVGGIFSSNYKKQQEFIDLSNRALKAAEKAKALSAKTDDATGKDLHKEAFSAESELKCMGEMQELAFHDFMGMKGRVVHIVEALLHVKAEDLQQGKIVHNVPQILKPLDYIVSVHEKSCAP